MSDPLRQFEHSHATLSKLAFEVGQALRDLPGRETSPAERRRLADQLDAFGNELIHHFAREEEGLFPFVRTNVPAKTDAVDRLVEGHDAICGAIVRLVHLVGAEAAPVREDALAHYARFEAAYARHSREEAVLLEQLGGVLDEGQRGQLAELLRGL